MHENLYIAYYDVQETNAKFFNTKKKKTRTNFVPTRTNFVPKCHWVKLINNFDLNQMSACVNENLYIPH